MSLIVGKVVNHFSAFITSILDNSLDEIDENLFISLVKLDNHTSINQVNVDFFFFFSNQFSNLNFFLTILQV